MTDELLRHDNAQAIVCPDRTIQQRDSIEALIEHNASQDVSHFGNRNVAPSTTRTRTEDTSNVTSTHGYQDACRRCSSER